MAKHMFLPKRDTLVGDPVPHPPSAGLWLNNKPAILQQVSSGLSVDEGARARGLSSIPDVWARPLTFYDALKQGSKHPMRAELIREWRGLISVIALSKLYGGFDLRVVQVKLDEGRLSAALRRLAPPAVRLGADRDYEWETIFLICCRHREGHRPDLPLGALSPFTLAYTSASYSKKVAEYLPKFFLDDRQTLRAPEDLDSQRYLAYWLGEFRKNAGLASSGEVTNGINALLTEWQTELHTGGFRPEPGATMSEEHIGETAPLIKGYQVYRELLRPVERSVAEGRANSDILLRGERNRTKYKEVVVVSPETLGQDVRVWIAKRSKNLGSLENPFEAIERHFRQASGTVIDGEDLSKQSAMWIRPEAYFLTDTLITAKGGATFLEPDEVAVNGGNARFLLPFRREILDFFEPKNMVELLKPEFRPSDEGVAFSFRLPVGEETITVRKVYRQRNAASGEGVLREVDPPLLCVFPRYLGPEWRRYYLFAHGQDDLRAEPVVNPTKEGGGVQLEKRERGQATTWQVSGDGSFPEAVELKLQSKSRSFDPAGLLVLSPGESYVRLGDPVAIGMDFGTSNTNAFVVESGKEDLEPWELDLGRMMRFLTPMPAQGDEILGKEFIPRNKVTFPVPTNLRVIGNRDGQLLLDYFIYFTQKYQLPPDVYTDIKWDEKEALTPHFLKSLFFLILIELFGRDKAPRELSFLCSYPKVFSDDQVKRFKSSWEKVKDELLGRDESTRVLNVAGELDRGDVRPRPRVSELSFRVEGQAAGHYFAYEPAFLDKTTGSRKGVPANKETGAVCLDVGGGTTDISLWSDGKIVYDASVLLAGRQFSALMQRNAVLRERLFSTDAAIGLQELVGKPAMFAARLNLVLRNEHKQIQENLAKYANLPEVGWLRRMLVVEFGAIAFYTAALVAAADRALAGSIKLKNARPLYMHWGGNAARLIEWIDFGRYSNDGIAATILTSIVRAAFNDAGIEVEKGILKEQQSPSCKSEVSGGLVVMHKEQVPEREPSAMAGEIEIDVPAAGAAPAYGQSARLVMGEALVTSTGPIEPWEMVTDSRLFPKTGETSFQETTLKRFDRFLEMVNFVGVRVGLFNEATRIALTPVARASIAGSVYSGFVKAAGMSPEKRSVEPAFITEVKALLDKLGSEMSR